ncbi:MAG: mechanosensitive ion channel, partial [Desulfobacteraceae bacterium]|nr:mechanosensitive ion channel [Desulfobacteraceae bacterium]
MNSFIIFFDRFHTTFGAVPPYLQVLLKALFAVAGSFIAWLILKRILASFREKTKNQAFIQINTQIYNLIEKAIFYGLIIVAGTYLIRLFDVLILGKIFHAFLIILLAAPLNDFMLIVLAYLEKKVADQTTTKIDNIIFDLLQKFLGAIIYATAIVLALDILGVNVMPFIAGAGVAGIAVGFAAKNTLSNIIAGILLIIDRPFEIGDR